MHSWFANLRPRGDGWLLFAVILLLGISILMVFSTTAITSAEEFGRSTALVTKHIVQIILGLAALFGLSRVRPKDLRRAGVPALIFCLVLLALVAVPGIGHVAGGARRWIVLGPLRIQPGELIKLGLLLYMSSYIARHHDKMLRFIPGTVVPLALTGFAALLLLIEPDFGSTVIILCVTFCQLLTASRLAHLAVAALSGSGILALLVVSAPYRFRRFEAFLDPMKDASRTGYQLVQSLIAVGSGGVWGAGLGAGKQKLYYLPAAHTDFIFAVIAEELGLFGAVSVLGLFLIIGWRGLVIARRLTLDPFLSSLALGCTALVVIPALLNMGVVLGLLPTKGLVLPLVAYGGTAMLVNLGVVGILLNLSQREPNEE